MSNEPIDKNYISLIDRFLYAFDKAHAPSDAQKAEQEKHARIAALRDIKSHVEKKAPNPGEFLK